MRSNRSAHHPTLEPIETLPQPERTVAALFNLLLKATEQEALDQAAMDACSSHICILDVAGNILAVNRAWRKFLTENQNGEEDWSAEFTSLPGFGNYLDVCDGATGDELATAQQVGTAIRAVLAGTQDTYTTEYPCHSPKEQRWFRCTVRRMLRNGMPLAVVDHALMTQAASAH